ncbi:MAG: SUF system NifU family Fe-S cluster assembly protein [Burkholderiales bacterium]|nr:SUF system NifU family Fe-S cluster assembly protein [Burkholderiales bacterium]
MAKLNKLYDDVIMDHIKNARNYRQIANADRRVEGFNPLCGDTLTVYLRLHDSRIEDAGFQCSCCGISMASASIMTEHVKGKSRDEALGSIAMLLNALARLSGADQIGEPDQIDAEAGSSLLASHLAVLNAVRDFPSRVECAALAWTTLASALNDSPQ